MANYMNLIFRRLCSLNNTCRVSTYMKEIMKNEDFRLFGITSESLIIFLCNFFHVHHELVNLKNYNMIKYV